MSVCHRKNISNRYIKSNIGNILGAAIGYKALPRFYKENLELHGVILQIADDLYRGEETDLTMYKKSKNNR